MERVKMSKGALPLPYIVAIIFAVIVIALIAYMFFTQTGIFSGVVNKENCEAKRLKYCFDWKIAGEANKPKGGWANYAPGCTSFFADVTTPDCEQLGIKIS